MMLRNKLHKGICLFFFLLYSCVAFSQTSVLTKNITLQLTDKPLSTVLKVLEKKADVNFVYVSGLFNSSEQVSIAVKDTPLKAILQQLFPDKKNIDFVASGQNIILTKKNAKQAQKKNQDAASVSKNQPNTPLEIKHDTIRIVVNDTLTVLKHDTIIKHAQVEINSLRRKSLSCSIGVLSAYTFPYEFMSQGNASTNVYNKVMAAEQISPSLTEGVSFDYRNGHWGFQTGLGLKTKLWSVSYNYQATATDYSIITGYNNEQSWLVRPHPPGEPARREDSTLVITKVPIYKTENISVDYKNANTASYVYIPLQLNYYIPFSLRWSLQLGVGLDLTLLYSAQGKILVSDNADLTDLKSYLSDYYLFGKTMLGVNYAFTPRHVVSLQLGFGSDITPVFRTNYPIQRYNSIISAGIAYHWWF